MLVIFYFLSAFLGALWTLDLALPNYQRGYRSVQSEAKSELSALYSASRYYHNKENKYSTDFNALGYNTPKSKSNYVIGFNPDCEPGAISNSFLMDQWHANKGDSAALQLSEYSKSKLPQILEKLKALPCPSQDGFVAAAIGSHDGESLDVWTINQIKILKNVELGGGVEADPRTRVKWHILGLYLIPLVIWLIGLLGCIFGLKLKGVERKNFLFKAFSFLLLPLSPVVLLVFYVFVFGKI